MHIHIRAFPPCGHTSTRWKHSISTIWGLTTMLSFLTHEERMLLFTNGRSSDWLYILPGPSRQSLLFLSVVRNWLIDKMLYRVSQQRDCPGFTPDSLLIFVRWPRISNQFGDKYREILNRMDTFCTKSSVLCNAPAAFFQNKCHIYGTQTDYRLFFGYNKRA